MSRLTLLLALAVALGACDSGDAIDPPSPADIEGTYDFAAFRFEPAATALQPANVLPLLVQAESRVEILDSGDVIFRYRLQGGTTRVLLAEVEVRRDQVRMTFEGQTDAGRVGVLLPEQLVFDRVDDLLAASTATRVDLEAYDADRYAGFNDVPGTLVLRLTPTGTPDA